jgi:hypothetical protein
MTHNYSFECIIIQLFPLFDPILISEPKANQIRRKYEGIPNEAILNIMQFSFMEFKLRVSNKKFSSCNLDNRTPA